jgi:hypothetical protein
VVGVGNKGVQCERNFYYIQSTVYDRVGVGSGAMVLFAAMKEASLKTELHSGGKTKGHGDPISAPVLSCVCTWLRARTAILQN